MRASVVLCRAACAGRHPTRLLGSALARPRHRASSAVGGYERWMVKSVRPSAPRLRRAPDTDYACFVSWNKSSRLRLHVSATSPASHRRTDLSLSAVSPADRGLRTMSAADPSSSRTSPPPHPGRVPPVAPAPGTHPLLPRRGQSRTRRARWESSVAARPLPHSLDFPEVAPTMIGSTGECRPLAGRRHSSASGTKPVLP